MKTSFNRTSFNMIVLVMMLVYHTNQLKAISLVSLSYQRWILDPRQSQIDENFAIQSTLQSLTCKMPDLFIYEEKSPEDQYRYSLESVGVQFLTVQGKYWDVQANITCVNQDDCFVLLRNGCDDKDTHNNINLIKVTTSQPSYNFQYLVNCHPEQIYKPFEWGLFILICICTITITLASFYSRAWSYGGYGISIGIKFLIIFNTLVILGSILAYYLPAITGFILKIVGSVIGVVGVTVCTSETLWLIKSKKLNEVKYYGKIRLLDIISFMVGTIFMVLYWVTQIWVINDVLAVCTIVAAIKILKIRSLKIGIIMLFSLLVIEIVAGLIVHYVLKVSYNNLVIQLFESPLVIVFPSITPQIYRKCAWLPVTSIIFPGMFISYLRRFDKSRGTFMYLLAGYLSFYIGSIIWMILDINTVHSLPLAIVNDPTVTLVVVFFANRRNQLDTIWTGMFYDPQLPDFSQDLILPNRYTNFQNQENKESARYTIGLQKLTDELKIQQRESSEQI